MQWDFPARNNPSPTHSSTPISIRISSPSSIGHSISSSPSPHVTQNSSEPPRILPVTPLPMSAPPTTPAFRLRTVPTVTREGRSLERPPHYSHSRSSSQYRNHERPHSNDRHCSRPNSPDRRRSRALSQDRHYTTREPLKELHQSSLSDHVRERRHSDSQSRPVVVVRPPPNSKVLVIPHRLDLQNGHLPQVMYTKNPRSDYTTSDRRVDYSESRGVVPPNRLVKHIVKRLRRPCLHRFSASQGMESFFPHPEQPAYNPTAYPEPRSTFQYSRCTGRKRALCIGINYYGSDRPLRGCINDALHIRDFLMKYHGFPREQIMVLRDDSRNPQKVPTRNNMLAAMRWLVEGAQKHDSLFFHYSGHGGQTPDEDGDELDGFDEVIYPVDYKKRGHILDDDLHTIMAKSIPSGCRLTALFDSCHSGTVLDLPYIYTPSGRKKGVHVSSRALQRKAARADVISWSGCRDDETSADTFQGGQPVGAMSYAFINSLRRNPPPTYAGLLKNLKALLYERFNQTPQLGSSHHIDTNLTFVI